MYVEFLSNNYSVSYHMHYIITTYIASYRINTSLVPEAIVIII